MSLPGILRWGSAGSSPGTIGVGLVGLGRPTARAGQASSCTHMDPVYTQTLHTHEPCTCTQTLHTHGPHTYSDPVHTHRLCTHMDPAHMGPAHAHRLCTCMDPVHTWSLDTQASCACVRCWACLMYRAAQTEPWRLAMPQELTGFLRSASLLTSSRQREWGAQQEVWVCI